MNHKNIPSELAARPQWVGWKSMDRDGKAVKVVAVRHGIVCREAGLVDNQTKEESMSTKNGKTMNKKVAGGNKSSIENKPQDALQEWMPGLSCIFCRKDIREGQPYGTIGCYLDTAYHLSCERDYIQARVVSSLKSSERLLSITEKIRELTK